MKKLRKSLYEKFYSNKNLSATKPLYTSHRIWPHVLLLLLLFAHVTPVISQEAIVKAKLVYLVLTLPWRYFMILTKRIP